MRKRKGGKTYFVEFFESFVNSIGLEFRAAL